MTKKKNSKKDVDYEIEKEKNTKYAIRDSVLDYMPYLIIIIVIVIIRTFIATPVRVNGSSMFPTLVDGDTMLLYKLTKNMRGIKRFDIVVIKTDSDKIIKRVIGLPGETIKYNVEKVDDNKYKTELFINGEIIEESFIDEAIKKDTCQYETEICNNEIKIPDGEYFVLGDNRNNSKDSRIIGTVRKSDILGTTNLVMFPFSRMGKVD